MNKQVKVLDDEPAIAGSLPFLNGKGLNLPQPAVDQFCDTSFLVTILPSHFFLVRFPAPNLKEN